MSQHSPWVVNLQLGFDSPNQRQAAASESPRRTAGDRARRRSDPWSSSISPTGS